MAHDVFISYSTKDKAVADAVVAALENEGIRCWYAPRDIRAGTDWGESITEAIGGCALMLLIFSKSSNNSKRVLDEIYFGISEGKTLLPFRIENLDPSGAMRLHLSSRHWLDAYEPSWKQHINELTEAVSVILKREEPRVKKVPSASDRARKAKSRGRGWAVIVAIVAIAAVSVGVYALFSMGILKFPAAVGPGDTVDVPTGTSDSSRPSATLPLVHLTDTLASPSATLESSTETPTATPTPDATEAPDATEPPFVEGSMVRADYDFAATLGDPYVHEDFESDEGFISTFNGVYRSWYENGVFNISYSSRGWWGWSLGDRHLANDFYVDVVVMHAQTCAELDTAGLVIRYNEGSQFGIMAGVSCNGKYWLGFSSGSDFDRTICSIVGNRLSLGGDEDCTGLPVLIENEYIASGPGAVNRIGIHGQNAAYEIYINGHEVARVIDTYSPSLPSSILPNPYGGYVGLFLGVGQDDGSNVSFDDFSMWNNP